MTTLGNSRSNRTPSGLKVAPQSYSKLEGAAESLRPLLPLIPDTEIIDAQQILEKLLPKIGYSVKIAYTEDLNEVAAFTIPDEQLIVIREDIYEGLFTGNVFSRSTIIHELCHIVLQHHVTLHRGAILGQHRHFEDSEWQAKAMTAAVMLPVELCRQTLNPRDLAERCGTSVQSAFYRLDKLKERGVI